MHRQAFCQVCGLSTERYKLFRRLGILPLYLHDAESERRGRADYSVGEAFLTCVMLELQRLGLPLEQGHTLLNCEPPELPAHHEQLTRSDGVPLVYIVADRRAPPDIENEANSPRLRVAATAWADQVLEARVKFSARGAPVRLRETMDGIASLRVVNLAAIHAGMHARARAAGIPLTADEFRKEVW